MTDKLEQSDILIKEAAAEAYRIRMIGDLTHSQSFEEGAEWQLARLRCETCKEYGECGIAAYYRDYWATYGDSLDDFGCILWEAREK